MKIEVKLFAVARQLIGAETVALDVAADATVGELRSALAAKYAPLATILDSSLVAVNARYATNETLLTEGAEVALLPPVSGG